VAEAGESTGGLFYVDDVHVVEITAAHTTFAVRISPADVPAQGYYVKWSVDFLAEVAE